MKRRFNEGGSMKGVPYRERAVKEPPLPGQSTSRRYASYWNAFLFLSHPLYIQGSVLIRNFTNNHFLKFGTGMLSTSIILRDCLVTFCKHCLYCWTKAIQRFTKRSEICL